MSELIQVGRLKTEEVRHGKPIECNQCGNCCRAFLLPYSAEEVESYARHDSWFSSINPVDEKVAESLGFPGEMQKERVKTGLHWYSCDRLEELEDGTAICSRYEERPDVCRRFTPFWMDGYLNSKKHAIYPSCTYYAEWDKNKPSDTSYKWLSIHSEYRPKKGDTDEDST